MESRITEKKELRISGSATRIVRDARCRSERAAYLRKKLEERERAEREADEG